MWNSTEPKRSYFGRSGRNSFLATTVLAALLSVGFAAGNAFGQDRQDAPPPPAASSPISNRGRAWAGTWAIVR